MLRVSSIITISRHLNCWHDFTKILTEAASRASEYSQPRLSGEDAGQASRRLTATMPIPKTTNTKTAK